VAKATSKMRFACKITVGLRRMNREIKNYFGAKNCTLLAQIKKVLAKAKTFFMGRVVELSWICSH